MRNIILVSLALLSFTTFADESDCNKYIGNFYCKQGNGESKAYFLREGSNSRYILFKSFQGEEERLLLDGLKHELNSEVEYIGACDETSVSLQYIDGKDVDDSTFLKIYRTVLGLRLAYSDSDSSEMFSIDCLEM